MYRFIAVLFLLFSFPISTLAESALPRNIILVIGDGMGLSQISAAKIKKGHLNLEEFLHIGLVSTHSANALVTDSAAAATAMASGVKTVNKRIGMNAEQRPLPSVLFVAKKAGWKTGVIATSRITHATPAAFVSHVPHRSQETEIARQITENTPDILFGGGLGMFLPEHLSGSERDDELNLLSTLSKSHHVVTQTRDFFLLKDMPAVSLLSNSHMKSADKREVSLSDMSSKALSLLSDSEKQFFLMIEGSQIDWRGHDNDGNGIIAETLDLDETIKTVLAFAKQRGDTLVVVTADHETGGFSIEDGPLPGQPGELDTDFTTTHHTATLVPIFAFGPGSDAFQGFIDNTDIGKTFIRYVQQQ